MSFKCRNDASKYEGFNMMNVLKHTDRYGRNGGQWQHRTSRDMWDGIGEFSDLPEMQVTDSYHVVEKIYVAVKKMVQETNEELDEHGINTAVNYKI